MAASEQSLQAGFFQEHWPTGLFGKPPDEPNI
jgi:hypothetical protein